MWWLSSVNYACSEAQIYEQFKKLMSNKEGVWYHPLSLLSSAVLHNPEGIALRDKQESITYKELASRVEACARFFEEKGVKAGDRVIICLENALTYYVAYYATWRCGAIVVPLNFFLTSQEINHIVTDAQPALIITQQERRDDFKGVPGTLIYKEEIDDRVRSSTHTLMFPDWLSSAHEMVALLYTSGTTGLPKGVMLSGVNIMTNVAQALTRFKLRQSEVVFAILPLFHALAQNAFLWVAVFTASTVIIVPKIDRRSLLWGLEQKPTIFVGVPALYGLLCILKTAPLDTVSYFICGGDALPDKIRMYFRLLYQRNICVGYGLTETSPLISLEVEDEYLPTANTGKVVEGVTGQIRSEENAVLGVNLIGKLFVRGDNIMMGYYNAPEETAKVIHEGWFDTGDLAYLSEENKIVITGRLKDLIINKGLNIYPQEIENVVMGHSNVIRVAVVGKKEESEGEVPIAFVQLRTAQPNIEKELKERCAQNLAPYKVPREFICSVEELPLTATGKVDKKVLRVRA